MLLIEIAYCLFVGVRVLHKENIKFEHQQRRKSERFEEHASSDEHASMLKK